MIPTSPAHEVGVAAHLVVRGIGLETELRIDGEDGHHLQRVRRLRLREHLTVADGVGNWRRYIVTGVTSGTLEIAAVAEAHFETLANREVTIAAALSKGTKLENVAMHLTELGVSGIRPLQMARSVVRLDALGAGRLKARLEAAVRAGAMQSRRAWLPTVWHVAGIESLTEIENLLVAAHDGDLSAIDAIEPGSAVTIVSGPEGGIEATERGYFASIGARSWSLGDYVLRAETAPLVATVRALV